MRSQFVTAHPNETSMWSQFVTTSVVATSSSQFVITKSPKIALGEVEVVCDHVIIINKGRIEADDTMKGLMSKNNGKSLEGVFNELTN